MTDELLRKIAESDREGVPALLKGELAGGRRAWDVHLSLFPVAARVLNPPYINPHLPKMYRIIRELLPYLEQDDIPALVELEVREYTARPKLNEFPRPAGPASPVEFPEVRAAIREKAPERAAVLLSAYLEQKGGPELAHKMLVTGGEHLPDNLGHSLSCTGFILLEVLERSGEDRWPALCMLADYFCKGGFHEDPGRWGTTGSPSASVLEAHLMRATSGVRIGNLHHTITRWAIERVRHLLSGAEYARLLALWVKLMGDKAAEPPAPVTPAAAGYDVFLGHLRGRAEGPALSVLASLLPSKEGRRTLGRYLVKGMCDLYHPGYDPHFLTGLAAALWVAETHADRPAIAMNALRQYVNYLLTPRTG